MQRELNLSSIKIIFTIFLFVIVIKAQCQNWIEVGGGVTGVAASVRCFYADSSENTLYVGGRFIKAGNDSAHCIAKWDGQQWSKMGSGPADDMVISINKFRDTVVAVSTGDFFDRNHVILNCIAKWNGVYWDSLRGGIDAFGTLAVIDDTLFVGGPFRNVDNIPANLLAKWDGNNWYPYHLTAYSGSFLFSIIKYNNLIYLGGNFIDSLNISLSDFCLLSGNQLMQVDTYPISPAGYAIEKMMIFKNELYIAGEFYSSSGTNIIKYDGINFYNIGGADYPVRDMAIFNNELYVVGPFENIGGIAAKYIARWDGSQWYPVCNDTFNTYISSIVVFENELYIGGDFTQINGQSVKRVAKYVGPLSVNEKDDEASITIFPNPSNDNIEIRSNKLIKYLTVTNVFGKIIISEVVNDKNYVVKLSGFSNGMYFIYIRETNRTIAKRIIKN